jgi:acetoin utilization deacetylase AcuC-like enzyme
MQLSTEGFSWLMQKIVELGKLYSKGRIISILEGGYSLKRLPELAANHVQILLNS